MKFVAPNDRPLGSQKKKVKIKTKRYFDIHKTLKWQNSWRVVDVCCFKQTKWLLLDAHTKGWHTKQIEKQFINPAARARREARQWNSLRIKQKRKELRNNYFTIYTNKAACMMFKLFYRRPVKVTILLHNRKSLNKIHKTFLKFQTIMGIMFLMYNLTNDQFCYRSTCDANFFAMNSGRILRW